MKQEENMRFNLCKLLLMMGSLPEGYEIPD